MAAKREFRSVAEILSHQFCYINGWAISEASFDILCDETARKVMRFLQKRRVELLKRKGRPRGK